MVHKNNSRRSEIVFYSKTFDERAEMIITPIEISKVGGFERLETKALWDTGSNVSCITSEIAGMLGLQPASTGAVFHIGNEEGKKLRRTYIVDFILHKNIFYKSITAVEISDKDGIFGEYGVVIGMDIIKTGNFTVENIGEKTKMTFRALKSKNNKICN